MATHTEVSFTVNEMVCCSKSTDIMTKSPEAPNGAVTAGPTSAFPNLNKQSNCKRRARVSEAGSQAYRCTHPVDARSTHMDEDDEYDGSTNGFVDKP